MKDKHLKVLIVLIMSCLLGFFALRHIAPDFSSKIFSIRNSFDGKYKITTLFGFDFYSHRKKKTQIIQLKCGLGNQMFQYAFGKALEHNLKCEVSYDISWFEWAKKTIVKDGRDKYGVQIQPFTLNLFKIKNLRFADDKSVEHSKENKIGESGCWNFDEKLLKNSRAIYDENYYMGYFQNEKYFHGIESEIKKDFSFPLIEENDKHNQTLLKKIRETENPVFIHVRRGDYLTNPWPKTELLTNEYYEKAIKEICKRVKNPTFFVFGQDCEDFIKDQLKLDCKFEYVEDENTARGEDFRDMQLMSMCKHGIIANSTFSWWAAWLCDNPNKIIIAPSPWLQGNDNIICKNWIKIKR